MSETKLRTGSKLALTICLGLAGPWLGTRAASALPMNAGAAAFGDAVVAPDDAAKIEPVWGCGYWGNCGWRPRPYYGYGYQRPWRPNYGYGYGYQRPWRPNYGWGGGPRWRHGW